MFEISPPNFRGTKVQMQIQKIFGLVVLLKLPPTLLNIDDRRANVTTTMLEESISVYCGVMPVGFRSIKALHMGFQENVIYRVLTLKSSQ